MKCIIIDDEIRARKMLKSIVSELGSNYEIVGEAENVEKGVELINNTKFDLLFLDIKMPDGTGFNVLEKIKERKFKVIFTTAYDQFAIKAIKYSALDYILKPIDSDELKEALKRAEKEGDKSENIDLLLEDNRKKDGPEKIVLSTYRGMHVVPVKDIIRCEADDYYTKFVIKNHKDIIVSKTLKHFNNILDDDIFLRVHKSHLVNLNYIQTYVRSDGGYLKLKNEEKVPVSRRKKELVLNSLNQI